MSTLGKAKRLAAVLLPPKPLEGLRGLWHRAQTLDPRRLRHRWHFQGLNREARPGEIVLRPGLRLAIDPRAREPFEWFCFRSPEMVRELDAFLALAAGRHRFLDVGALHGIFSLAFTQGRTGATAVAVEPSPLAWEVLQANLRLNREARVTPVQAAVGAAPGTLIMRSLWHHLLAAPEAVDDPEAVELPLRTLDSLCGELAFRPDMMKIDVEGYELAVLRGAREILRNSRPILFLELHPERIVQLGGSLPEISALLTELGYRIFDLRSNPVSQARLAELYSVSRFCCRPSEPPSTHAQAGLPL
jgi:FkbM family methyltransferase